MVIDIDVTPPFKVGDVFDLEREYLPEVVDLYDRFMIKGGHIGQVIELCADVVRVEIVGGGKNDND